MKDKIMVEVLDILTIATEEIKRSRVSQSSIRILFLLAHGDPEKF